MRIEDLEITKGGNLTIYSIFELESSLDVSMHVDRCRRVGCTVRFENEDLTIDSRLRDNPGKMATYTLYSLLVSHPKAAQDYYHYLFKKENQTVPGK